MISPEFQSKKLATSDKTLVNMEPTYKSDLNGIYQEIAEINVLSLMIMLLNILHSIGIC